MIWYPYEKMKTMEMPKWLLENETANDSFNQDIEEKFRHHKAMIQDDTEHLLHILWSDEKDPKRNAINYILDKENGVFIIYGMFGNGIASWHRFLPVRVLLEYCKTKKGFIQYLEGYLDTRSSWWTWNKAKAKKRLLALIDYCLIEHAEGKAGFKEIMDDCFEMERLLNESDGYCLQGNKNFENLWKKYSKEDPYTLGESIDPHVRISIWQFFRAAEQLGWVKFKEENKA